MPVINRHIINSDINYDGANRDDLFRLINRWKRLLHNKHGVTKGDVMALGIFDVNHNHLACLFAAAELGLKIFIMTKPIARETIPATKMAIFGPVDITVQQEINPENPHVEMFQRYSKKICFEREIDEIADDSDIETVPVEETDTLIFTSSSGTTGGSKPAYFSHREVYEIANRNISAYQYQVDDVMQHTTNLHHASVMLTYLFPSLMICKKHFYGTIAYGDGYVFSKWETPDNFVRKYIIENKATNVFCTNKMFLELLLTTMKQFDIPHRVSLNISGFVATEELYQAAKELPVRIFSHYGSTETGIPLLINTIDSNSEYEENYLGRLVDDFYTIENDMVTSKLWRAPRNVPDKLSMKDGRYYFYGRKEPTHIDVEMYNYMVEQIPSFDVVKTDKLYLVIWDQEQFDFRDHLTNHVFDKIVFLKKQDFVVDTKVSMEQLTAYLDYHS